MRSVTPFPWRVTSVIALADARLDVTFVDGTSGKVDMRAFLSSSKVDGTVFELLRDPAVFTVARVVMGAVQWPGGADLAPDAMYDAIRESGVLGSGLECVAGGHRCRRVLDVPRDRLAFLSEQLKVKQPFAAQLSSIPDLYQPPEPNQ